MNVFSKNLRRFRLSRQLTQEQAAESLGVSAQSVSRWECGTTWPDVAILPKIARLYEISIDDLYRENSPAYDNYAQRLGSIYEASRKMEDFLLADREYQNMIRSNAMRMEDWRLYGILYQYMMEDCRDKALSIFDEVMRQKPADDPNAYWRTRRQRLYLLSQTGKSEEAIREEQTALRENPTDSNCWICLIAAYINAGKLKEAETHISRALSYFPENPCLFVFCGNVYAELGKTDDAFRAWERALELDPDFLDARYSMGFCLEELGEYKKAAQLWGQLARDLERLGFEAETTLPSAREKFCAERCQ